MLFFVGITAISADKSKLIADFIAHINIDDAHTYKTFTNLFRFVAPDPLAFTAKYGWKGKSESIASCGERFGRKVIYPGRAQYYVITCNELNRSEEGNEVVV